jgi:hypothetical protein
MAKAIFEKRFCYSSRKRNAGWDVGPSPEPQDFPEELVAAAVKAGAARRVPPRRRKPARPDDAAA